MTQDKQKLQKTSLSLDPDLMKEMAHECIDRNLTISDACHEAFRLWLKPKPFAIPDGNDKFIATVMGIVNDPRNEAEKYLRILLKSAVNLRYIADEPIVRRNTGESRGGSSGKVG